MIGKDFVPNNTEEQNVRDEKYVSSRDDEILKIDVRI